MRRIRLHPGGWQCKREPLSDDFAGLVDKTVSFQLEGLHISRIISDANQHLLPLLLLSMLLLQDIAGIQTAWGTITAVGMNPFQGPAVASSGRRLQQGNGTRLLAEGNKPVSSNIPASAAELSQFRRLMYYVVWLP